MKTYIRIQKGLGKHKGHVKTITTNKYSWSIAEFKPKTCKACKIEKQQAEIIEDQEEKERILKAEELSCDKCGIRIGLVNADDLEGSNFYCMTCKLRLI